MSLTLIYSAERESNSKVMYSGIVYTRLLFSSCGAIGLPPSAQFHMKCMIALILVGPTSSFIVYTFDL